MTGPGSALAVTPRDRTGPLAVVTVASVITDRVTQPLSGRSTGPEGLSGPCPGPGFESESVATVAVDVSAAIVTMLNRAAGAAGALTSRIRVRVGRARESPGTRRLALEHCDSAVSDGPRDLGLNGPSRAHAAPAAQSRVTVLCSHRHRDGALGHGLVTRNRGWNPAGGEPGPDGRHLRAA